MFRKNSARTTSAIPVHRCGAQFRASRPAPALCTSVARVRQYSVTVRSRLYDLRRRAEISFRHGLHRFVWPAHVGEAPLRNRQRLVPNSTMSSSAARRQGSARLPTSTDSRLYSQVGLNDSFRLENPGLSGRKQAKLCGVQITAFHPCLRGLN